MYKRQTQEFTFVHNELPKPELYCLLSLNAETMPLQYNKELFKLNQTPHRRKKKQHTNITNVTRSKQNKVLESYQNKKIV